MFWQQFGDDSYEYANLKAWQPIRPDSVAEEPITSELLSQPEPGKIQGKCRANAPYLDNKGRIPLSGPQL